MPDEDTLPLPPERKPREPPDLEEDIVSAWRLHRGSDALEVRFYERGRYRFDAPTGQYPTTYANADRLGAFAEVYGDIGRIKPAEGTDRFLVRISSPEPMKFVALDRGETLKALGLDARICVSRRYGITREWSSALHRWHPLPLPPRHPAPQLLSLSGSLPRFARSGYRGTSRLPQANGPLGRIALSAEIPDSLALNRGFPRGCEGIREDEGLG